MERELSPYQSFECAEYALLRLFHKEDRVLAAERFYSFYMHK